MKLGGPLLLVGCGKMGSALLDGWLSRGLSPADVWIVEPNAAALQGEIARGVNHAADAARLPADLKPALMVFAVKPQMLAAALPHYEGFRSEEHTSELQSLMRISYAVFCLKKKKKTNTT